MSAPIPCTCCGAPLGARVVTYRDERLQEMSGDGYGWARSIIVAAVACCSDKCLARWLTDDLDEAALAQFEGPHMEGK